MTTFWAVVFLIFLLGLVVWSVFRVGNGTSHE